MNFNFKNRRMKTMRIGLAAVALALATMGAQAQTKQHTDANVAAGEKALLANDFKSAVTHFQKATTTSASDPNVFHLLGLSQYQLGDYKKAAANFSKAIALDANHFSAHYYRAKANNVLAVNREAKTADAERESLLKSAIADYSKAIALKPNEKNLYQNRAIANRDLGVLTGTSGTANYNKKTATDAYNAAIEDYKKVLSYDASRKDIQTEVKKATVYRDNLK